MLRFNIECKDKLIYPVYSVQTVAKALTKEVSGLCFHKACKLVQLALKERKPLVIDGVRVTYLGNN